MRVLDMPGKEAMGKIKIAHSISAPLKSSGINHGGWFRRTFISLWYYCHTGAIYLLIKLFLKFVISLLQCLHYDMFNDLSVNMKPNIDIYYIWLTWAQHGEKKRVLGKNKIKQNRKEFCALGSTQCYV